MGTKTSMSSPAAVMKKVDALEAGVTKDIVGKATVGVSGTAMTAAQIKATLGVADTNYAAVVAAKQALKAALAVWEAALPALKLFMKNLEAGLKAEFGVDSIQLLDFGINPLRKPAKRTAAEIAVSSAEALQTRQTRGTTSKAAAQKVTTEGKKGLALIGPDGSPIPGLITGPTPPGSGTPVDAAANLAPVNGSTPSGGSAAAPATGSTPSGK